MSVLGGFDVLGWVEGFVAEKLVKSDGFVAAWADAAVAETGHEDVAVFASLGA